MKFSEIGFTVFRAGLQDNYKLAGKLIGQYRASKFKFGIGHYRASKFKFERGMASLERLCLLP